MPWDDDTWRLIATGLGALALPLAVMLFIAWTEWRRARAESRPPRAPERPD